MFFVSGSKINRSKYKIGNGHGVGSAGIVGPRDSVASSAASSASSSSSSSSAAEQHTHFPSAAPKESVVHLYAVASKEGGGGSNVDVTLATGTAPAAVTGSINVSESVFATVSESNLLDGVSVEGSALATAASVEKEGCASGTVATNPNRKVWAKEKQLAPSFVLTGIQVGQLR